MVYAVAILPAPTPKTRAEKIHSMKSDMVAGIVGIAWTFQPARETHTITDTTNSNMQKRCVDGCPFSSLNILDTKFIFHPPFGFYISLNSRNLQVF
jgi:hypothetical protein